MLSSSEFWSAKGTDEVLCWVSKAVMSLALLSGVSGSGETEDLSMLSSFEFWSAEGTAVVVC